MKKLLLLVPMVLATSACLTDANIKEPICMEARSITITSRDKELSYEQSDKLTLRIKIDGKTIHVNNHVYENVTNYKVDVISTLKCW